MVDPVGPKLVAWVLGCECTSIGTSIEVICSSGLTAILVSDSHAEGHRIYLQITTIKVKWERVACIMECCFWTPTRRDADLG